MGGASLRQPPLSRNPFSKPLTVAKPSGREKTTKHKHLGGIGPGLGGCQKAFHVFFFFGPILLRGRHAKKKTH